MSGGARRTPCPSCGSSLVDHDDSLGGTVCTSCGAVLDEDFFNDGAEFVVGHDGAQQVAGQFIPAHSQTAARSGRNDRIPKSVRSVPREETLRTEAFSCVDALCSSLSYGLEVRERAKSLTVGTLQRLGHVGKRLSLTAAACVYVAARSTNPSLTITDVAAAVPCSAHALHRWHTNILQYCPELSVPSTSVQHMLARALRALYMVVSSRARSMPVTPRRRGRSPGTPRYVRAAAAAAAASETAAALRTDSDDAAPGRSFHPITITQAKGDDPVVVLSAPHLERLLLPPALALCRAASSAWLLTGRQPRPFAVAIVHRVARAASLTPCAPVDALCAEASVSALTVRNRMAELKRLSVQLDASDGSAFVPAPGADVTDAGAPPPPALVVATSDAVCGPPSLLREHQRRQWAEALVRDAPRQLRARTCAGRVAEVETGVQQATGGGSPPSGGSPSATPCPATPEPLLSTDLACSPAASAVHRSRVPAEWAMLAAQRMLLAGVHPEQVVRELASTADSSAWVGRKRDSAWVIGPRLRRLRNLAHAPALGDATDANADACLESGEQQPPAKRQRK